jgi:hypothetical protein
MHSFAHAAYMELIVSILPLYNSPSMSENERRDGERSWNDERSYYQNRRQSSSFHLKHTCTSRKRKL